MRYKHLLDGLEVSILSLKEILENIDFRIDAEFHKKGLAKNLLHQYVSIGSILKRIQYGLSIEMNEDAIGTKIYRMNEIHNMICDSDVAKWADISSSEKQVFKLYDGDVLFNRTNSFEWVGRTGLFKQRNDNEFVFASYLIRLNPDIDRILPEYLTTFLNSKFGVWDIKRRARMSINQSNVNAEEVKAIQIPLLSKTFQQQLKICFDKAIELQNSAEINYQTAEHLLLDALGLRNWQPTQANTAIISLSNSFLSSGRLDAEYYQPKYEQLLQKIQSYTNGYQVLSKVCKINDLNFTIQPQQLYDYIELSDIGSIGEVTSATKEFGINLPSRARRKVLTGDIVLSSIEGSLQKCAIITENYHNALCSTGFYVLSSSLINAETLLVLFKSEIMQTLLKQACSGTILTSINQTDLLQIPIPLIDLKIQTSIKQAIQTAQSAQQASKQLLSVAQEAVERAITSGEASALTWIAQNS